jgi:shikimate dehydrogenase
VRFALLGFPLSHSLSPVLHQAAYRALGLPHRYELIECPDEAALARAVGQLRRGELAGANVTLPHKRAALALADAVDDGAVRVGAANVLVAKAGQVVAHNTDVTALIEELTPHCSAPKHAVVLGGGGAARACVIAAQELGATRVEVFARRFEQQQAAHSFAGLGATPRPWAAPLALDEVDLLFQATSAGMAGADDGTELAERIDFAALPASCVCYELVYRPERTPFLERARQRGCRALGGLGMLVRQAIGSIELWLGQRPPFAELSRAARAALAGEGSS